MNIDADGVFFQTAEVFTIDYIHDFTTNESKKFKNFQDNLRKCAFANADYIDENIDCFKYLIQKRDKINDIFFSNFIDYYERLLKALVAKYDNYFFNW